MVAQKTSKKTTPSEPEPELVWLRAAYAFHTYAYRDPSAVFAFAAGIPVVSPSTVLLGIASCLFSLGLAPEAQAFLQIVHQCKVAVDAPDGAIFFRAFHQIRRYESAKYDKNNPRIGLTKINQGTREYGLFDGNMTVFVGVPTACLETVKLALTNLNHLGTHDSLCSLVGKVELTSEPKEITYTPAESFGERILNAGVQAFKCVTVVTLSCFKNDKPLKPVCKHWYMAGGNETELIRYVIPGKFEGTTRGKIYRKH
jgi:hypothetical protein